MSEAKVNSKIAVVIVAMAIDVILAAYSPNLSFSQVIPFLPKGQSNIATNSNHRIIHHNNNNTSSDGNNKLLSSGKTTSYLYSLNGNNVTNTTKLKSLPSQTHTAITGITKLSNKELDKFGIAKLYPTKPNGEEWFMNMSNPTSDPRFNLNNPYKHVGKSSTSKFSFAKNPDGSWNVASPKVRIEAYTSAGYNQSKITTYNQPELAAKGYMQSPNDWKNVEITGYVKYNSGDKPDENFDWYTRGGIHTDDNKGCEGTAYKGNLYYSGNSDFGKEQWHENGFASTDTKINVTSPLQGKWIGFKFVLYNLHPSVRNDNTTTTFVKLENWINENSDGRTWKKIDEKTDDGAWGKSGSRCGGTPDQIITWGGPIATFRWDGANDVDIKNFSVREIEPPTK
ncbi:MAG: hypothetical protein ACJ71R_16455 [Nitrososphaeraceae archaeon]